MPGKDDTVAMYVDLNHVLVNEVHKLLKIFVLICCFLGLD